MKQEAEDIGLQGKDIAEYVTRQQMLDREQRAAWRDTQKRQVEIRMAELQAEDKKRVDESHIKIQIAQTDAAKEQAKIDKEVRLKRWSYKLNKLGLLPVLQPLHPLVIKMPNPQAIILYRREG